MTDLLQILIRKALVVLAGWLIAHNVTDAATAAKLTDYLLPVLLVVVSIIWSKCHLFSVSQRLDSPKAQGSGLAALICLALLGSLLLTGCETALNSNKIVSVKQRCFGLVLETTDAATQTPNVKLGFVSTVWQVIPTSTNAIYAPDYMDTFDLDQGLNPFSTGITENTGAGSVMIGTNGEASALMPK